eukprot:1872474-Prymnesium_polylepis.1
MSLPLPTRHAYARPRAAVEGAILAAIGGAATVAAAAACSTWLGGGDARSAVYRVLLIAMVQGAVANLYVRIFEVMSREERRGVLMLEGVHVRVLRVVLGVALGVVLGGEVAGVFGGTL